MRLLNKKETKETVDKGSAERQRRITKLNDEESRSIKRLNVALEEERSEKQRIADEAEKGMPTLVTKKTILIGEVDALEERKKQALTPIKKIKKEAEVFLRENIRTSKILKSKLTRFRIKEEELVTNVEILVDRQDELNEQGFLLDKREKAIKESEGEVSKSAKVLSGMWVEYHDAVLKSNTDLEKREKEVQEGRDANAVIRERLDTKEEEQKLKDKEIADKYATLGRAIERFNKKKNG